MWRYYQSPSTCRPTRRHARIASCRLTAVVQLHSTRRCSRLTTPAAFWTSSSPRPCDTDQWPAGRGYDLWSCTNSLILHVDKPAFDVQNVTRRAWRRLAGCLLPVLVKEDRGASTVQETLAWRQPNEEQQTRVQFLSKPLESIVQMRFLTFLTATAWCREHGPKHWDRRDKGVQRHAYRCWRWSSVCPVSIWFVCCF